MFSSSTGLQYPKPTWPVEVTMRQTIPPFSFQKNIYVKEPSILTWRDANGKLVNQKLWNIQMLQGDALYQLST